LPYPSGFTDGFYKALLEKYPPSGKPEMSRTSGPYVYCETGGLSPDIWFNPQEVWQMAAADITSSPVYSAGASYLGSERGVSLRFPRFISRREDKGIEEATSSEQLADMYKHQIT
jgi:DNA ligase-1